VSMSQPTLPDRGRADAASDTCMLKQTLALDAMCANLLEANLAAVLANMACARAKSMLEQACDCTGQATEVAFV
jgi:hypothetical protein